MIRRLRKGVLLAIGLAVLGGVAGCDRTGAGAGHGADPIADPARARAKVWSDVEAQRKATEGAAAAAAWKAAPDCPDAPFKFVSEDRLSIEDLAQVADDQTSAPVAGAGRTLRLGYMPFDYENHPVREGWAGVGIVHVRADPADRRTIGGVLWTRGADLPPDGGGTFEISADGAVLTISAGARYADAEETKLTCVTRFRARLTPDGTLLADGKQVGVFR